MNSIQTAIHKASMKILSELGFGVQNETILNAMKNAGFRVEGTTIFFTEEQVMDAVHAAPKSFTIRARNPEKDVTIGEGPSKLGAGYGCTFVADRNGVRRDAMFEDYIKFAKLVHHSGQFGVNGGILVQPSDLPADTCYPTMLYAAMMLSDMALLGFSAKEQSVRDCMELCEIAFGGHDAFVSDYHILTLVNILTPLQLGDYGEQTLIVAAEYNQPVILTPGISAGATSPITPSGTAAVGNAEILAAITIAQTLRRGLPVVYGLNGSILDMKAASTRISNPLSEQVRTFGRSMAVAYELPSRCGGGLSDAKKPGLQSNFEGLFCLMNSIKERTSISLHSAGILDSFMAMNYEKFMMDCEAIRTIRLSMAEMDVSDDAIGMEDIFEEGIGGNFLAAEHTIENFREYSWQPAFSASSDINNEDPADADQHYLDRVCPV